MDVLDEDDDGDGRTDSVECYDSDWHVPENSSFEVPAFSNSAQAHFVDADQVPGWETTDLSNEIEIWDTGHRDISSVHGKQHAEINAHTASSIFRDVELIAGSVIEWAFYHRGRMGADIMELSIGPPGMTEIRAHVTTDQQWTRFSGYYVVPPGQTLTRFIYSAVSPVGSSGNLLDLATVELVCVRDSDGDGCPDGRDRD